MVLRHWNDSDGLYKHGVSGMPRSFVAGRTRLYTCLAGSKDKSGTKGIVAAQSECD